jgi:uncharacterized protein (TIGR02266 family)
VDVDECADYGSARDAIDAGEPVCVVVDPSTRLGRELCLDGAIGARGTKFAMIGLVSDPAGNETADALTLGLDDVLPRGRLAEIARKVCSLLEGTSAGPSGRTGRAIVLDRDRRRRADVAEQLRRTGLQVEFATDHTEVRFGPDVRLVVASARQPETGPIACMHAYRRRVGASQVPWLFVGGASDIDRLAPTLAHQANVACHRLDTDTQSLAGAADTLLRPPLASRRRSARIEFETPVSFQTAEHPQDVWGCSSDLSMGGVFVRTLTAPPMGTAVTLTMDLPNCPAFTVRGAVAWRSGFGTGNRQGPGFGVQFDEAMDPSQLAVLSEGYRLLLESAAEARLAGRRSHQP